MNDLIPNLQKARSCVVLTGAGISAESGIPTFRGAGGYWHRFKAMDLATPKAWARNPVLVWAFYNWRRTLVASKSPNAGHRALVQLEAWCQKHGKDFWIITQNVDDLHLRAGSQNLIRLHGSLWEVQCTQCSKVYLNEEVPILPAYQNLTPQSLQVQKIKELPRCECSGILRPHVVWFGESLDPEILQKAWKKTTQADVFMVIGTSASVYPAASLIPLAKAHGAWVAEFNIEPSDATERCDAFYRGPSAQTLVQCLNPIFST